MMEWDADILNPVRRGGRMASDPDAVYISSSTTKHNARQHVEKSFCVSVGAGVARTMGWVKGDRIGLRFHRVRRELCLYRVVGDNNGGIVSTISHRSKSSMRVLRVSQGRFVEDVRAVLMAVADQKRTHPWRKTEDGLVIELRLAGA